MSYAIQPEDKAFLFPQRAQITIGLQKDFLRYILSVLEIEESGIDVSIYTSLILIHKQAKRPWFSIETSIDYAAILSSQFSYPYE